MNNIRQNTRSAFRHAIAIGLWAFFLASAAGLLSQTGVKRIPVIGLAFLLLLAVILVGVVFDIVGVAATVASESALHARAANRVFGASQSVRIVKNASRVASFCNDVVGDVCGTLSGAIGVSILFRILANPPEHVSIWSAAMITALIAALAVGGKALGKAFAVERGTLIVFRVGQFLAWLEKLLPVRGRR